MKTILKILIANLITAAIIFVAYIALQLQIYKSYQYEKDMANCLSIATEAKKLDDISLTFCYKNGIDRTWIEEHTIEQIQTNLYYQLSK